jgi:hypothetical protein
VLELLTGRDAPATKDACLFVKFEKWAAGVESCASPARIRRSLHGMSFVGCPDLPAPGAAGHVGLGTVHPGGQAEDGSPKANCALAPGVNFLEASCRRMAGRNDAPVRLHEAGATRADWGQVVVLAKVWKVDAQGEDRVEQAAARINVVPVNLHSNTSGQKASTERTGPVAI